MNFEAVGPPYYPRDGGGDHFQSFDFVSRLLDSESKLSKPSTFRFILESHAFKLDSES